MDNSLYTSGLRYDNVIQYFDNDQSDKWNERVYNQDAQYKYIGPYTDSGNNNLLMLQGKRQSHRRWWLSKRFSLYDSKFVSGDFKGKAFEFKVINNTEPGWTFTIKAGIKMEYGYAVSLLPTSYAENLFQISAGQTPLAMCYILWCASSDDVSSFVPPLWTKVNDMVRTLDDIKVMLYDQDRMASSD